ncbi:putative bifunctional diguanylate cyclase/phosphodiesterase [Stappia indica]|uniref:putative bifunctional diguanylate cyclase/phosphodiesterase n=1 Tax=Stappia indica TaxID=538381 RepID=UPI001D19854B|nr:GGDEF domain-containing phosphodiesterase [Stappia indica]MCC4243065.1 EAL domain-containing protein [Stappia indica]
MRNLKTLLGIFVGVLIVAGFAGTIQATNVFFSKAIYTRDAQETARRLDRDLNHHLLRDGKLADVHAAFADESLRRSIDSVDAEGEVDREDTGDARTVDATGPALPTANPRADREASLTEFLEEIDSTDLATTVAMLRFAPGAVSLSEASVLPRIDPQALEQLAPRIENLMRSLASGEQRAVDIPSTLFGKRSGATLLAVPIRDGNTVEGAIILFYDQATTGLFLTEVVQIGIAILIAMIFVAVGLAALFMWMRFRDRLKASKTIQFLAHHDALTGLPNRTVFSTKLNEALRLASARAGNLAVMLIDVDKFKAINDTHGHAAGDLFLQVIADRLSNVFGNHLVARLSGDEFAVLIARDLDRKAVTQLASSMIAATRIPTRIDGKDIPISLSIGVAQASEAAWRASRLLHCADLALYRAKHSGRSTYIWYTPDMDAEAQKRKALEGDLRKALAQDEFRLLYQPQFSLRDLKLTGYEALLRWEHPERGTISPTVFIPIAEDAGLIEEIGAWVLLHACREASRWRDTSLTVAVNISPAQFSPGQTEERVAHALKVSGLAPERLEVEITESLLISDTNAVVKTLTQIRQMGVSVAMDDFGTGYSSLSYLSRFPFDTIKIDRSFVATVGKNPTTDAIIASIVGLGRSLEVTITAEGVEDELQVALLRAAGCDKVQGFLFGKPMDLTDQSASDTVALAQQTRREKLLLTAGEPELPQLPLAMPEKAEADGPRLPDAVIDADIDTLAMELDADGVPMPADAEDGREDTDPAHDRARAVGAV